MSTFQTRMFNVRRNPSLMQQVALEELDQQLQGRGTYDVQMRTFHL